MSKWLQSLALPFHQHLKSSIGACSGETDSGIFMAQFLSGSIDAQDLDCLYRRKLYNREIICSERFPEDLLVFSQLLSLVIAQESSQSVTDQNNSAMATGVDRHEVLALVHKLHSPEKLMKSLLNISTLNPFEWIFSNKFDSGIVSVINEVMESRILVLSRVIAIIDIVHEASKEDSFPRWSHSKAFLARCQFALDCFGLLKYINETRTASGSSLLAQFIQDSPSITNRLIFEETILLLIINFGLWLEEKGLNELGLLWLDSFNTNIPITTVPIDSDLEGCFNYVRGRLCLHLGREKEFLHLMTQVSLLFPSGKQNGYLQSIIANGQVWDQIKFLSHCIELSSESPFLVYNLSSMALMLFVEDETEQLAFDSLCLKDVEQLSCSKLGLSLACFEALLRLDKPSDAFNLLHSIPNIQNNRINAVRSLAKYLIVKNKSLLIQLPWGEWYETLIEFLEEWSKTNPTHLSLLYSLHSSRANYKTATACLIRLARSLDNWEEVHMLLLLAKQTLLLCHPNDTWLLLDKTIISLSDIDREIAIAESVAFVIERTTTLFSPNDIEFLLSQLFSFGAYRIAIKLLQAHGRSVEPVLVELAQELVYHQQNRISDPSVLEWIDLWLENTECVALDPSESIGKILRGLLADHSEYYSVVVDTILQSQMVRIPEWLHDDHVNYDVNAHLRLLMQHGYAEDAVLRIAHDVIIQQTKRLVESSLPITNSLSPDLIRSIPSESLQASYQDYLHKSQSMQ